MLDQAASALRGIRLYAGLIPGIAFLIGAAILLVYPIRGAYKQELEDKVLALHAEEEK